MIPNYGNYISAKDIRFNDVALLLSKKSKQVFCLITVFGEQGSNV